MTHDHLEQLAAELLGCKVYVCLESDGATSPLPGCWACTSPSCDLLLRPWLESIGRRGRRPAIYLDDLAIRRAAPDESAADEMIHAVLCHELAHVAEQRIDLAEVTAEATGRAMALAAFSNSITDSPSVPPFFGHTPAWLRAVFHVHHRMSAWHHVHLEWLFDHEALGLSHPDEWLDSLNGEPAALAAVPIFELPRFRPPQRFQELWIRNVERWRDANPSRCANYIERSLKRFEEANVKQ